MSVEKLLAHLQEPSLQEIVRFWDGARAGRRFPAWRNIDPVALAPHLPILWAWRWDKAQQTFIGRLAGEAILDAVGPGFRGTRLQDFFESPRAEMVMARYRRVIDEPALMYNQGFIFSLSGGTGTGERVALPLAEDGVHPDGLLGATVYRLASRRLARDRITIAGDQQTVEYIPI